MDTKISIDSNKRFITSEQDLINILLNDRSVNEVYVNDEALVDDFNQKNEEYFGLDYCLRKVEDQSFEQFHQEKASTWFIPDKYKHIDVLEYLLNKVSLPDQIERVNYEYQLYKEKNLLDILRLMIYLVDHFRENNILWGVGRGSSVASYILFVIGINRVDSLKYDLDVTEFLK